MGIFDAAFDSLGGVLADQWKDVVTVAPFDEHTAVAPGIRKSSQNGRGANMGAEDILSNGSIIFVPENTAAFIFSQAGIEQVITQPGGFEYRDGEASVFDEQDRREKGLGKIILDQAVDRIGFSGMSSEEKRVAFVNLREMRGLKFGTRGPLAYNDFFYGTDLEVFSYGSFSVQVSDPELFVRNFVPANVSSYSLDDPQARSQLLSEFLNSFIAAVNSLSATYRVSQLPSQTNEIAAAISSEDENAGTWPERFGLRLAAVAIENIEFSDESRELVRQFSEKKMGVRAYEDVSQRAANVAAQQMIAQGVRDNGLGDGGGMLFGMDLAQSLNPQNASTPSSQGSPSATSLDDQIETLKKLKDLLDLGILSQQEFDAKKREILGL
ncbi:SPFH domain-containing protein [Thermophilibacter mediterraneus]|uniref:SPFH domain-containing protein n=1 Tax=Thermophilibacter mediterraneus TaxID=1871031 RepID=UPI00235561E2|nr:SPFH domain-containing protein [Thermophilibacter mediterraneus]